MQRLASASIFAGLLAHEAERGHGAGSGSLFPSCTVMSASAESCGFCSGQRSALLLPHEQAAPCMGSAQFDQPFRKCGQGRCLSPNVLVHVGHCYKIPSAEWIVTTEMYISVLEAGSPRSESQQIQGLVRAVLLAHRCHFLTVFSRGRKRQECSLGSLYKGTSHLPKASLPNHIMLGVRIQHMNLGGP